MNTHTYDILAVGELLVDLIGHDIVNDLSETRDFHRYQGGSPANLAANIARLGGHSALVACVGEDNFGKYLRQRVAEAGVATSHIASTPQAPTSIVVVSRTHGTPDFIAFREADRYLLPQHLPDELLQQCRIFHTTCFALSRLPAQVSISEAAQRAASQDVQLSIDLNYAPAIWPDRQEALRIIHQYVGEQALVKLSEDDAERIFGEKRPQAAIVDYFLSAGAKLVCLTLGKEGCLIGEQGRDVPLRLPAKRIEVTGDATGAGDAFWAGFLSAWLRGHDTATCARAGSNMAAIKLQTYGPIKRPVSEAELLAD